MGNQPTDFLRGKELARTLPLTFCELAQQVFIGASKKIGLYIIQAQPVAGIAKELDQP